MQNVAEDRNKYIGGSDIPIIMGLSKFKSRWQLLKEKAGIEVDEFEGNRYTEYGNVMEEKNREHINTEFNYNFHESKKIGGDRRWHVDGYDAEKNAILEVKTTSRKGELKDYTDYLVQALDYSNGFRCSEIVLAIYQRPDDFDEEFNSELLTVFVVNIKDHGALKHHMETAIDLFREDLWKLKANPFLTENDLQPNEIQSIAQKVMKLELELVGFKELEAQHKSLKQELYEAMTAHNIKSWELPNGAKITRVAQGEDKEATAFQEVTFKKKHPELHKEFLKKQIKKGRAGYVKITLPKVVG